MYLCRQRGGEEGPFIVGSPQTPNDKNENVENSFCLLGNSTNPRLCLPKISPAVLILLRTPSTFLGCAGLLFDIDNDVSSCSASLTDIPAYSDTFGTKGKSVAVSGVSLYPTLFSTS